MTTSTPTPEQRRALNSARRVLGAYRHDYDTNTPNEWAEILAGTVSLLLHVFTEDEAQS